MTPWKGRPYNNKGGEPTVTNLCLGETLQQHTLKGRPYNNKLAWGDPAMIDSHQGTLQQQRGTQGFPGAAQKILWEGLCDVI